MCSGDVEDQEDVMRQLSEHYKTLDTKHDQKKASDYSALDLTREAKTWTEIVDRTLFTLEGFMPSSPLFLSWQ